MIFIFDLSERGKKRPVPNVDLLISFVKVKSLEGTYNYNTYSLILEHDKNSHIISDVVPDFCIVTWY